MHARSLVESPRFGRGVDERRHLQMDARILYRDHHALGVGVFIISGTVYNLAFFDKYRGTTMSLIYIAWSAAGMDALSLLYRLCAAYPLKVELLLTRALLMQAVPLGMLLRNPSPVKLGRFAARRPVATTTASANTISKKQLPLQYQRSPRHDRCSDSSRTG
ncbi:hypothetical protein HPB49_023270 [Dermacentor silvarum]|uniref:Uncharacterized protein n=1 Tax=Dermacentor silvarum TaxID=543639 RepID=A0ACB8CMX7_DERSI|nr:hypothetical protein HPB49_023270 [Dermacentor silvarum]